MTDMNIIHFDLLQLVYQQQSNSGNTELSSDIVEYIIVTWAVSTRLGRPHPSHVMRVGSPHPTEDTGPLPGHRGCHNTSQVTLYSVITGRLLNRQIGTHWQRQWVLAATINLGHSKEKGEQTDVITTSLSISVCCTLSYLFCNMRLSPYQSYSYPTIYYLLFSSSRALEEAHPSQ